MDIYEKIDKLLQEKNMSKKDLSIKSGVPYSTIVSAFNRHSDSFSISHIQNIANALNVPVSDILNDEQFEDKRLNQAYKGLISILDSIYDNVNLDWHCVIDNDGIPEYNGDYTITLVQKDHVDISLDKADFEILFTLVKQNIPAYINLIEKTKP